MKIIDSLRWGEAQLQANGVEDPRIDADLLLAFVLNLPRDRLYLGRERSLTESEEASYRALLERRGRREPLQYILGRQEFMGLEFRVDRRVLIPRPDSEILVEKFLEIVPQNQEAGLKIVDLCTGSGALAIAVKYYRRNARVVGTDISQDALEIARLNAERLGVMIEWRRGDFCEPAAGERWDWIICNPPYVSSAEYAACAPEIAYEPAEAFMAGGDGLNFYRRLADQAASLLSPGGRLLMEIGWRQAEAVRTLLQNNGLATEVFPDLAGRNRVILAR